MQQAGEDGRLLLRVAHLGWGGVHGKDLDRGRQQLAARVADHAALGGDLLVLGQLLRGHRRKPVVLEDVPPGEPPANRRGDQREKEQQDECAGATVGPGKHARLLAASRAGSSVSELVLTMAWWWAPHPRGARMRRPMLRVGEASADSLPGR